VTGLHRIQQTVLKRGQRPSPIADGRHFWRNLRGLLLAFHARAGGTRFDV